MQLILAWVIRNASEDPLISEVNELLTGLLGTPSNVKWNGIIKTLEQTIMSDFSDMTGSNHPMIYHTTHMDVTSKNMNNSFY